MVDRGRKIGHRDRTLGDLGGVLVSGAQHNTGFDTPTVATTSQLKELQAQTGGRAAAALRELRDNQPHTSSQRTSKKPRKKPVDPSKFDENELKKPTPESELGKLRDQKAKLRIRIRGL